MKKYPKVSRKFDLLFIFFGSWLAAGVFIDGWAHNHLDSSLETFFTPWHAVLYSGFAAIAILLIYKAIKSHAQGFRLPRLLPREYHLSFLGLAIFLSGGIGDMIWHIIFGIEADVEALLSPPHLIVALGGAIIISAPFHALWHRDIEEKPPTTAILLALTYFISLLCFMTQFAHPVHRPWMDIGFMTNPPDAGQSLGVASIIIQTGILMGIILTTIKRWRFPFGGFTLVFGLNTFLMAVLTDQYRFIPGFIVSGLIVDVLYKTLRPGSSRPKAFRFFAILTPMIMYSFYTATIFITSETWWSIHLWAGTIVMAGITGFLLSYLVVEPARGETLAA